MTAGRQELPTHLAPDQLGRGLVTVLARRSAATMTVARHRETTAALLLPVAGESARRPEVVAKAATTPVYPRET